MPISTVSPRQVAVIQAMTLRHAAFEPPNEPVSIATIADAMGVRPSTVKEYLRRLRRSDPAIYREVMTHRREQFRRYHAAVAELRRERSRRWGKRRWAARYRREHGVWPWEGRPVPRAG
jgi:IS30 family transposase